MSYITVNEDGFCFGPCGHLCPCDKKGEDAKCSVEEIEGAGKKVVRPENFVAGFDGQNLVISFDFSNTKK